jgi:hypothetical protein
VLRILWPSFLAATLAEGFFFSLFDPHEALPLRGGVVLALIAIYTTGFFLIWGFCALASTLTYYLVLVPDDGNGQI